MSDKIDAKSNKFMTWLPLIVFIGMLFGIFHFQEKYERQSTYVSELEDEIDAKDEEIKELKSKLEDMGDYVDQVKMNSDNLQRNVQRLNYENWEEVVPDIADSANDVNTSTTDLESQSYQ